MTTSPASEVRTGPASRGDERSALRAFDGIVCFGGEDWWYHNRGHYDMRMMRALSADVPVLYVNSLGMRFPRARAGAMFTHRIARKYRSLRRGLVRIDDRFSVLTAPMLPGRLGRCARYPAAAAVRRALRTLGVERPLAWVACPTAADLLDHIPHSGLVYQRTDRYESFLDVDAPAIIARDRALKAAADTVIYCSSALRDDETGQRGRSVLVDHGVDAERFAAAAARGDEPADVRDIPRPRVGFVGAIDAHTLDPDLLESVTAELPDAQFILVGASTLPDDWCDRPNVHHLGQRAVDEIPAYMAACDVLIMPWRRSSWIDACHPVKLKEYLATGRPIVTTPFRELDRYPGLTRTAEDPAAFAAELRTALQIAPAERAAVTAASRARVTGQTWDDQAMRLRRILADVGLRATDGPMAAPAAALELAPLAGASRLVQQLATFIQADPGSPAFTLDPVLGHRPGDAGRLVAGRVRLHPDLLPDTGPGRDTDVAVRPVSTLELKPSSDAINPDTHAPAPDPAASEAAEGVSPSSGGAGGSAVATAETPGPGPIALGGRLRLVHSDVGPAHDAELPAGDLPIDAAVVLAGGLRTSGLLAILDRSPVDLWIRSDQSVLESWVDRIRDATAGRSTPLPIRVVSSPGVPAIWPTSLPGVSIERDPHAFRGPAGVVRDLARHLAGDRHVLVVESARHLDGSLASIIADHLAANAAVTVGCNHDHTPAGIYLIRRDVLDLVPPAGWFDLKEQFLPRVQAAGHLVLVHRLEGRGAMPLRTREQLIEAARVARRRQPRPGLPGPELPGSALRVVCRGAMVGPDACIFDSIVMPGAYVGPRSTVVRSIIGPDTVVPPDVDLVDCVLHAGRVLADEREAFRAA